MKRSLLVLVLAPIAIFSFVTVSHSQYTITQLSNNDTPDMSPQINDNGYVVWYGHDGSDFEIFLYHGTSTTQLTNNPYGYEDFAPQINNDGHVVWAGGDGSDSEIFLYDGTSTTQLTNNSYDDYSPQINEIGWVVWAGGDGSDSEIFLYDGTSTTQLTNNSYDDIWPQINDNGYVVWMGGWAVSDWEIFLYDGASTTQLTNNPYDDVFPQINDNGYVVWYGHDGSDDEIFLYDGTSTTQLTNNTDQDWRPQINEIGWVVWERGQDTTAREIFLYDGTSTTQISNNDYRNYWPQINNSGHVVWYGSLPDDHGIFLAVPDFCIDNDADGYGNPVHAECTHPELDCDNSNSNIYPTNSNTNCDCQEPIPQGTAENCSDMEDNDCDGWIDLEDSDCNPDTDGDGISNEVDTVPRTHSNDFSDESLNPPGVTSGIITSRGDQLLTITEEANPSGVKITADSSGGATQATLSACDGLVSLSFDPGDDAILTCGSAHVEVIVGPIEGVVAGEISITVPGGATATVTEIGQNEFQIENTGTSGTITVEYEGEIVELNTGETVSITTPGACSATAQASTHQVSPVYGSTVLGVHLAYLLLPIGVVIGLRIWRMKR